MAELIVLQGCATIQLIKGLNTLIDEADWSAMSQRKWGATRSGNGAPYAGRQVYVSGGKGGRRTLYMHREITRAPRGMLVDHRNCDTLDNRRSNLRLATKAGNAANARKPRTGKTSQFKGVSWSKARNKWVAHIRKDGKGAHLGHFDSEAEAAVAYNRAASEAFGEFARVNADV